MAEETDPHEIREQIEQFEHALGGWRTWLALTTALIAVVAAVVSLASGYYADRSLLEKNNAVLLQNQASNQWGYYQAKGVKKNVAEGFADLRNDERLKEEVGRYAGQQEEIRTQAEELDRRVKEAAAVPLFRKRPQRAQNSQEGVAWTGSLSSRSHFAAFAPFAANKAFLEITGKTRMAGRPCHNGAPRKTGTPIRREGGQGIFVPQASRLPLVLSSNQSCGGEQGKAGTSPTYSFRAIA